MGLGGGWTEVLLCSGLCTILMVRIKPWGGVRESVEGKPLRFIQRSHLDVMVREEI